MAKAQTEAVAQARARVQAQADAEGKARARAEQQARGNLEYEGEVEAAAAAAATARRRALSKGRRPPSIPSSPPTAMSSPAPSTLPSQLSTRTASAAPAFRAGRTGIGGSIRSASKRNASCSSSSRPRRASVLRVDLRRLAANVLVAWQGLAGSARARRAVQAFCDQYRAKVLMIRTVTALRQHARFLVAERHSSTSLANRALTALRQHKCAKLRARNLALAALQRWEHGRFAAKLELALEVWRRSAARGKIRRRCEQTLTRWLRTSRLRQYIRAWSDTVWRNRRAATSLELRRKTAELQAKRLSWRIWLRVVELSRRLKRHFDGKVRRSITAIWDRWWKCVTTARRSWRRTRACSDIRMRGVLRRWRQLRIAIAAYAWRRSAHAFRVWRRAPIVIRVAERVQLRHKAMLAVTALRSWNTFCLRSRRAACVEQITRLARVNGTLRAWSQLSLAFRYTLRKIFAEAFGAWRVGACRRARSREWLASHFGKRTSERATERRGAALRQWADWTAARRRNHRTGSGCDGGVFSSSTLSMSQRRGDGESAAIDVLDADGEIAAVSSPPDEPRLKQGFRRWRAFASERRRRQLQETAVEEQAKQQAKVRALWRWRDGARQLVGDRDNLLQASAALGAIHEALRWERAHDACAHWSSWAARARGKRGRCAPAFLSRKGKALPDATSSTPSGATLAKYAEAPPPSHRSSHPNHDMDDHVSDSKPSHSLTNSQLARLGEDNASARTPSADGWSDGGGSVSRREHRLKASASHSRTKFEWGRRDGNHEGWDMQTLPARTNENAGWDGVESNDCARGPPLTKPRQQRRNQHSLRSDDAERLVCDMSPTTISRNTPATGSDFRGGSPWGNSWQASAIQHDSESFQSERRLVTGRCREEAYEGAFSTSEALHVPSPSVETLTSFNGGSPQVQYNERERHQRHRDCNRSRRREQMSHHRQHLPPQVLNGDWRLGPVEGDPGLRVGFRGSADIGSVANGIGFVGGGVVGNYRVSSTITDAADDRRRRRRHAVRLRWTRWSVGLWLSAVMLRPWLQWTFALWRGTLLRAELQSLRWWSLALWLGNVRQVKLPRIRRIFEPWRQYADEANQRRRLRSAVCTPVCVSMRPRNDRSWSSSVSNPSASVLSDGRRRASVGSTPPSRGYDGVAVGACFAIGASVNSSSNASAAAFVKQPSPGAVARQRERLAEVSWSQLTQQLAIFLAWAGLPERSAALSDALAPTAGASPCEAELLLCTFSAWVTRTCLRGRREAQFRRSQSTSRIEDPRSKSCRKESRSAVSLCHEHSRSVSLYAPSGKADAHKDPFSENDGSRMRGLFTASPKHVLRPGRVRVLTSITDNPSHEEAHYLQSFRSETAAVRATGRR
eukprot:TRINITY_DN33870_c0_g1_i1.p1 TRINITY_DN33870_c0_g1~~TRINITY_DN33870_c0_g1_i1.p1  ORF type:complete len:1535 (-),score=214.84 TRINITY_DN33870_c0_g1_i1:260-4360(-)